MADAPITLTPEQALSAIPFAQTLGVEFLTVDAGEVTARMAWAPEKATTGGGLHGGAIMAFADSVGAVVAFLNLPAGAVATTTVSSATNFLRGVREGDVTATSRPLHRGRSTIVVETDLVDDAGKRVAKITQTQAVLHP